MYVGRGTLVNIYFSGVGGCCIQTRDPTGNGPGGRLPGAYRCLYPLRSELLVRRERNSTPSRNGDFAVAQEIMAGAFGGHAIMNRVS